MSEPTAPPPVGDSGDQSKENNVTPSRKSDGGKKTIDPGDVKQVLEESPDQRVDPYGETCLGFSVTNVDDKDRPAYETAEPKTAFNTDPEDVETPEEGDSTWPGTAPFLVVNNPYDPNGPGSPFDQGGFIGNDPYRAVLQEGVRDPGNETK